MRSGVHTLFISILSDAQVFAAHHTSHKATAHNKHRTIRASACMRTYVTFMHRSSRSTFPRNSCAQTRSLPCPSTRYLATYILPFSRQICKMLTMRYMQVITGLGAVEALLRLVADASACADMREETVISGVKALTSLCRLVGQHASASSYVSLPRLFPFPCLPFLSSPTVLSPLH
jgi:hypothetical protein